MKEAISVLNVNSSGLEERDTVAKKSRTDNEIIQKANSLSNLEEKEKYLIEELKDLPTGLVKSKLLLSEIIKDKNLKLSCELLISASFYSPLETEIYVKYSKLALRNNAFKVAKSALDVSKWVLDSTNKDLSVEINKLEEELVSKTQSEKESNDPFWLNKFVSKSGVLDRLYLQSVPRVLVKYCFKLLDTFPNDFENYYIVFSVFSLLDKNELLEKLALYVEKYLSGDEKNKALYLGLIYFRLFDFKKSLELLSGVVKSEPTNSRCLLFVGLNHLMMGNLSEFITISSLIIPTSEQLFVSVYFINSALSGFEMDKNEFPNQKEISKSISRLLELLLKNKRFEIVEHIIAGFKKLDYYFILPSLPFYCCEMFILNKSIYYAKLVLEGVSNPEVHRFNSWIYRIEGNSPLAEKELLLFRKSMDLNKKSFTCKLISLDLPEDVSADEKKNISALEKAYKEVNGLIKDIDLEYGIDTYTCIEAACQDCCKKTFPYVSYVEYLCMRNWFEKQSSDYKENILKESKEIVKVFKEKYKKDAFFVIGEKNVRDEYPMDFFFQCPYLGDNKCNIYEARPFTCRAYGYGSQDGVKFKGCNYLYSQYKFATDLHDERKVVNMHSFYDFTTEADRKMIGEKVLAPIPVWFAQSHEETMKILKSLIA